MTYIQGTLPPFPLPNDYEDFTAAIDEWSRETAKYVETNMETVRKAVQEVIWEPGTLDHGDMTGLADDDHSSLYLLLSGARKLTGNWDVGGYNITNIGTGTFGKVGIGTISPDSIFHIKANVAGTVGSHPAGQLIIQDPDDTVFGNAVITGYESDGAGNPDQQLWYLGSSSSSNSDIIFLNRRNSKLQLGTNGVSHLTILGNGNIGIGTTAPSSLLEIYDANNNAAKTTVLTQTIVDTDGSGRIDYFKFNLGATSARGGSIVFGETGGGFGESGIDFNLNLTNIYQYGSYPITFTTNGLERVRILGTGFVGINNVNPTVALDVTGATLISTTLDVVGNIDPTTYETTRGGFKDEDDMASNSAVATASQQSIKAYTDSWFNAKTVYLHLGGYPVQTDVGLTIIGSWYGARFLNVTNKIVYKFKVPTNWTALSNMTIKTAWALVTAQNANDLLDSKVVVYAGNDHELCNVAAVETVTVDHDITDQNAQHEIHFIDFTVTGSNLAAGDVVNLWFYRTANANTAGYCDWGVLLHDITVAYTADSLGD